MCRWIAYVGKPIRLRSLMYQTQDSFVGQSIHARQSSSYVNGDGCGLGWYHSSLNPGIFRTTRPAWNSGNLRNLADVLESHLFLAHVRATSGTTIQETNCHPFRHKHLLFQHNGAIGGYERLKQALDAAVSPEIYADMEGSTDTERMFYLALSHGLADDCHQALCRMVEQVEQLGADHGIDKAIEMTVAVSQGTKIHAVRYATTGTPPTLFYAHGPNTICTKDGHTELLEENSVVLLSEPLDEVADHWREIPVNTFVTASPEGVELQPFAHVTA